MDEGIALARTKDISRIGNLLVINSFNISVIKTFSVRRLVVRRTFMQGFSLGKDSRMKEMGMQALGKVKMKSVKETSLGVAQALFDP